MSALGLGYLPGVPGTWASAGATVLYVLFEQVPFGRAVIMPVALVACLVAGWALCPWAERHCGKADPAFFVLDEVAGLWLTCLLFWWRGAWPTGIVAFAAFRFFDGLKPFPVGRLERLRGSWGVMLDDLAAGVCAAAVLWPLCYFVIDPLLGS